MKVFSLPLTAADRDELPSVVTVVCDVEADRNTEEEWGNCKPALLMFGDRDERWLVLCDQDDVDVWLAGAVVTAVGLGVRTAALVTDQLLVSNAGLTQIRAVVGVLASGEVFTILRTEERAVLEWEPEYVGRFAAGHVAPLKAMVNSVQS